MSPATGRRLLFPAVSLKKLRNHVSRGFMTVLRASLSKMKVSACELTNGRKQVRELGREAPVFFRQPAPEQRPPDGHETRDVYYIPRPRL